MSLRIVNLPTISTHPLTNTFPRDGTMFSISFTPIEYGKEKQGKLLIYTDEMLWSYMFKGTFPLYKVPM